MPRLLSPDRLVVGRTLIAACCLVGCLSGCHLGSAPPPHARQAVQPPQDPQGVEMPEAPAHAVKAADGSLSYEIGPEHPLAQQAAAIRAAAAAK